VNQQGFPTRFALIDVVSQDDHCWMESVRHLQCRNRKEAAFYYFRAGALSCLIHWLRGVDFHAGNIIAAGGQPVFVDCETLFHPDVRLPRHASRQERSILRTGIMPIATAVRPRSDSVSALGRTTWGSHSVQIRRKTVSASEFVDSIADGFRTMHRFLSRRYRSKDKREILKYVRRIPYRQIRRPTATYCLLLERSLSAAALRNGVARRRYLAQSEELGIPIRHHEIKDLENGDIPILHGKASVTRSFSARLLNRNLRILRDALL